MPRVFLYLLLAAFPATLLLLILLDSTFRLLIGIATALSALTIGYALLRSRKKLGLWFHDLPLLGRGTVAGTALWSSCFVVFYAAQAVGRDIQIPAPVGMFSALCGLLAMPIAAGGWMLVWGDDGPPDGWFFHSLAVQVVCGLALNIFLCTTVVAARALARRWQ